MAGSFLRQAPPSEHPRPDALHRHRQRAGLSFRYVQQERLCHGHRAAGLQRQRHPARAGLAAGHVYLRSRQQQQYFLLSCDPVLLLLHRQRPGKRMGVQ